MYQRYTEEQIAANAAAQDRAKARAAEEAEWQAAGRPLSVDDARARLADAIAQRDTGAITREKFDEIKSQIDTRVVKPATPDNAAKVFESKLNAILGTDKLDSLTPTQIAALWDSI